MKLKWKTKAGGMKEKKLQSRETKRKKEKENGKKKREKHRAQRDGNYQIG